MKRDGGVSASTPQEPFAGSGRGSLCCSAAWLGRGGEALRQRADGRARGQENQGAQGEGGTGDSRGLTAQRQR